LGYDQVVLLRAKSIIAQVLGRFDEDEFFQNCRNSSGSTVGVSYTDTSSEAKFKKLTHTKGVDKWFRSYLQYDTQLKSALSPRGLNFIEVLGSNATTVPKDSKKVRMICVEPTLNMFFQQGLMHMISSRLERVGLSFEFQQDINREAAWLSSITGKQATIDWSSASDTLSLSLIEHLLPARWFYYLKTFRSDKINILGGWEDLHMFSTMGNACTFPLETLVFWSLACAVSVRDVKQNFTNLFDITSFPNIKVFGDDCIVDVCDAKPYIDFMIRYGFLPNADKSFLDGPFRESCGGDFLAGQDVRPYFLTGPEDETKTHLHAWLNIIVNRLLNRFIRIFGPLNYIYAAHSVFDCLFSLYRDYKLEIYLVPTYFPDDAGVKFGVDLFRFLKYFRIRDLLSEITIDRHGTRRFNYLAASFSTKVKSDESIRYWLSLKGFSSRKAEFVPIKRRLFYQVAGGVSPCFCLNRDGKH